MSVKTEAASIRILPDDVANKIAAGEVVERPASVVKELVENSLDAGATKVTVRIIAAGRRLIEVTDNGHGMSEQNALLAIERHATSKIRNAQDLEAVKSMGFRGEALASIASVSHFTLVTRRAKDESATQIRIDGGTLRDVEQVGAPVGTRITANRLYFNTPVRAKFLKGITTELGHCIDVVQRHALAREGVGFQFFHNDKLLLDIPAHARLRERVALIWGLNFVNDMIEIDGQQAGFRIRGIVGLPGLTRAARSHQFFFMNGRPVVNRSLQYGFEDAYRGLVTVGRRPVGILLFETAPRLVDVNIHPTKKEIRFRDERAARDAVRDIVRAQLAEARQPAPDAPAVEEAPPVALEEAVSEMVSVPVESVQAQPAVTVPPATGPIAAPPESPIPPVEEKTAVVAPGTPEQGDLPGMVRRGSKSGDVAPDAVYTPLESVNEAPLQIFDTYLLVPSEERLLIIDQHALHERLNYDSLLQELEDSGYASQQLAVPLLCEVPPSHVKLMESNLELFSKLGLEIESFGGNTFQITSICHLYEESRVSDVVYQVLDELAQGDLFDKSNLLPDLLRLATRACKSSVRAGDRLTPQERLNLVQGFKQLRPPYTCPHGRPIVTELTLHQMEKSFRRIQ